MAITNKDLLERLHANNEKVREEKEARKNRTDEELRMDMGASPEEWQGLKNKSQAMYDEFPEEDERKRAAVKPSVRLERAVEDYISIWKEYKVLEQALKEKKEKLHEYMSEEAKESVVTPEGQVNRTIIMRPTTTSNYTKYDMDTISDVVPANLLYNVLDMMVNAEKLEALWKGGFLGQIHLPSYANLTASPRLTVTLPKVDSDEKK